jgi:hypothetical protein
VTVDRQLVGLHGRNDVHWHEGDDAVVERARIGTLKMMSLTDPSVLERLRGRRMIVRLYNEPNHVHTIEGWGPWDEEAYEFRAWYLGVLALLRQRCPWASLGFPGLALNWPHRDLQWLEICRAAVEASDWLGCHCYWQYDNMLHPERGAALRTVPRAVPGHADRDHGVRG